MFSQFEIMSVRADPRPHGAMLFAVAMPALGNGVFPTVHSGELSLADAAVAKEPPLAAEFPPTAIRDRRHARRSSLGGFAFISTAGQSAERLGYGQSAA